MVVAHPGTSLLLMNKYLEIETTEGALTYLVHAEGQVFVGCSEPTHQGSDFFLVCWSKKKTGVFAIVETKDLEVSYQLMYLVESFL